ncbi:MAG: CBS domain-containing protein [Deltaproteobacteria bacterium]|nr:CBS domain-containing protein [Deltaproteobacteria bacterium]
MSVAEMMSQDVKTCRPQDTLNSAAHLMWEFDCGCVPVVDSDNHVVGMLTDRDICMAAYTQGALLSELGVASAMSKEVYTCGPQDTPAAAEELMRAHQIRRLPVVDAAGRLVGLVSLNDLAREAGRQPARKTKRQVKADEVITTLAAICARRPGPQLSAA